MLCSLTFGLTLKSFIWQIFRELQAIENGETDPVIGPNSLDKERCLLNDDPKWLDTTYVLANYKTEPCKKPPRLCRQGYACPQFHNNKDKRRSPKKYKYRSAHNYANYFMKQQFWVIEIVLACMFSNLGIISDRNGVGTWNAFSVRQ